MPADNPSLETRLEEARRLPMPVDRALALRSIEFEISELLGRARAHRAAAFLEAHEAPSLLSWTDLGRLLDPPVSGERARQLSTNNNNP